MWQLPATNIRVVQLADLKSLVETALKSGVDPRTEIFVFNDLFSDPIVGVDRFKFLDCDGNEVMSNMTVEIIVRGVESDEEGEDGTE